MKPLLLFLTLLFARPLASQTGSATTPPAADTDLQFVVSKIKNSYAGYRDKISGPEMDALVRRVAGLSTKDSFYRLSVLTSYFNDDHLSLFQQVSFDHIDSQACRRNLYGIGSPKKALEGYYADDRGNCIIYLKQTARGEWAGYAVESRGRLPAGFPVLRWRAEEGGRYQADFIDIPDRYRVVTAGRLKAHNVLIGGGYFKFRPCPHYSPGMPGSQKEFSFDPAVQALDSETVLIHLPDFGSYNRTVYDSLVRANEELLARASTLILDIRNNAGGSVRCFMSLVPYICTSAIHTSGALQLCSDDLIEDARTDWKTYIANRDSASAAVYAGYVAELEKHRGGWRLVKGSDIPCEPRPTRLKHVAILMDHGTRSAAELMALYFKESDKVRLFGENTRGAVDYLDILSYKLPVSGYQLWVGSSKRQTTIAQPAFDATGIPPDVPIPDSVPDWIQFVRNYYRSHYRPK